MDTYVPSTPLGSGVFRETLSYPVTPEAWDAISMERFHTYLEYMFYYTYWKSLNEIESSMWDAFIRSNMCIGYISTCIENCERALHENDEHWFQVFVQRITISCEERLLKTESSGLLPVVERMKGSPVPDLRILARRLEPEVRERLSYEDPESPPPSPETKHNVPWWADNYEQEQRKIDKQPYDPEKDSPFTKPSPTFRY